MPFGIHLYLQHAYGIEQGRQLALKDSGFIFFVQVPRRIAPVSLGRRRNRHMLWDRGRCRNGRRRE
jgi:hypothetical protein